MQSSSEIILSANSHPGDSTVQSVTGDNFKGDGYYGRADGVHTVQATYTDFVGTITIQGTLQQHQLIAIGSLCIHLQKQVLQRASMLTLQAIIRT